MVQRAVVLPGTALESEPALPALEANAQTGDVRHAHQQHSVVGDEAPRLPQLPERVLRVLEHMIQPHGVEADSAEVDVRQLAFPDPRAVAACGLRDAYVGAADLPPASTGVAQKGAGAAADVEHGRGTPPNVAFEPRQLSRERPLAAAIDRLVPCGMVAGGVYRGGELIEHGAGMLKLQTAGTAARQAQALEVDAELPRLAAAQGTVDRFPIRQGGLDLVPRASEE